MAANIVEDAVKNYSIMYEPRDLQGYRIYL